MAKLSNGNITVRVLVDTPIGTRLYRPNEVVELPPKIAARLTKAGQVDPDGEAVQYALSSGAKVIVHKDDEQEAPADESGAAQEQ